MEQNIGPYKLVSSREVYKNPWIQVREDKVCHNNGEETIFGIMTMKPGSFGNPDSQDAQNITCIKMKFTEALELVMAGKISHAATCVAMLKTARILGV